MNLILLLSVPAAEPLEFHWAATALAAAEGGAALKRRDLSLILVPHSSQHTKLISHEEQTWQGLSAVPAVASEQGEENTQASALAAARWCSCLCSAFCPPPGCTVPTDWIHSFSVIYELCGLGGGKNKVQHEQVFFPADHRLLCLCSSVRGFSQSSVHSSALCYWHTDKSK